MLSVLEILEDHHLPSERVLIHRYKKSRGPEGSKSICSTLIVVFSHHPHSPSTDAVLTVK